MTRMKSHMRVNRVGETFINNQGYVFVIVRYNGANDLWVEFQDEHKAVVHAQYSGCKSGGIKNPYHKTVCGVGCLGLMNDGTKPVTMIPNSRKQTKEYRLWHNMINRCYNKQKLEEKPTYKNVEVCNRWLVFSNFIEDLPMITGYKLWLDGDNYDLDKDIKSSEEFKEYSLKSCTFVPHELNMNEVLGRSIRIRICAEKEGIVEKFDSVASCATHYNLKYSTVYKAYRSGSRTNGYKIYEESYES